MPQNKDAFTRYRKINETLRKRDFVKSSVLSRICNVTTKTIQNDIKFMKSEEGYNAPIEYNKSEKAYYYSDDEFTIETLPLLKVEKDALLFYAKCIYQYKNYSIFKSVSSAIGKVLEATKINKNLMLDQNINSKILTELIPESKGNEFIQDLIIALKENRIIKFNYQKFTDEEPSHRILKPYLLKEDKHFWYIIGKEKDNNKMKTFALDRIKNLEITDEYFYPDNFNANEHFKYSFGITVEEIEPIEILLSFNTLTGKYIKTLPIHSTQEIKKDDKNELVISIKVKPSYEFYSKILSYGSDVKIISPQSVVKEIKKRLNKNIKIYLKKN